MALLRYSALLLAILLSVGRASWADELLESWRCFDSADFLETESLLTLARYQGEGSEYGVVTLPGVEPIATFFKVNGLERRWDWYVVMIMGDGLFRCVQKAPPL